MVFEIITNVCIYIVFHPLPTRKQPGALFSSFFIAHVSFINFVENLGKPEARESHLNFSLAISLVVGRNLLAWTRKTSIS